MLAVRILPYTFFWISLFLIVYHYVGFPLVVVIRSIARKKAVIKKEIWPKVTLVIAAYNEEKVIEEKIRNSLTLDYPRELLEVIVVSDGSTDDTPAIVKRFERDGIIGLFDPVRRGKTAALNRATGVATGEVVVFSDANCMYDKQAIRKLVRNFYDPSVGGVTGRKVIIRNPERESSGGDKLFWNFESFLKTKQSLTGSISTGDGEIFAIRRVLYKEIPNDVINDDTAITLNIIKQGYRVVYEPEAISSEEASVVLADDFNVKVRMVCGGYQTLRMFRDMLLPPRSYFAVQFLSHKALRWLMPVLLLSLFVSNLFILKGIYKIIWLGQTLFYLSAAVGLVTRRRTSEVLFLYYPLYYCTMNLAAAYGLLAFLRGRCNLSVWKKARR